MAEARVSIQVRVWTPAGGAIRAAGRVGTPARGAIPAAVEGWIGERGAIQAEDVTPVLPVVAQDGILDEGLVAATCGAQVQALIPALVVELVAMPERDGIPARALTLERAGRVGDGLQAAVRVAAQPRERGDRPPGEPPEPDGNPQPGERERNAHRSPDGSRLRFVGDRGSGWQTGRDSASPPVRLNVGQVRVRRGARCGPQPEPAWRENSVRRGRRCS